MEPALEGRYSLRKRRKTDIKLSLQNLKLIRENKDTHRHAYPKENIRQRKQKGEAKVTDRVFEYNDDDNQRPASMSDAPRRSNSDDERYHATIKLIPPANWYLQFLSLGVPTTTR